MTWEEIHVLLNSTEYNVSLQPGQLSWSFYTFNTKLAMVKVSPVFPWIMKEGKLKAHTNILFNKRNAHLFSHGKSSLMSRSQIMICKISAFQLFILLNVYQWNKATKGLMTPCGCTRLSHSRGREPKAPAQGFSQHHTGSASHSE